MLAATSGTEKADRADWALARELLGLAGTAVWPEPLLACAAQMSPGHQRQAQDGALLLDLALQPAPLALRQAALEGLAVGLAAWPVAPLCAVLFVLAQDLHGALAAKAVDLLARLPPRSVRVSAVRPTCS